MTCSSEYSLGRHLAVDPDLSTALSDRPCPLALLRRLNFGLVYVFGELVRHAHCGPLRLAAS